MKVAFIAYASSEDLDEPARPRSLVRAFVARTHKVLNEKKDQTKA